MKKFRKPLIFTLCLLPAALIGGWFAARSLLSSMDEALIAEAIRRLGSMEALIAVTVLQTVIYAAVCGFLGYVISEKIGLMRPIGFEKAKALRVILISTVCGIVLSLDAWTFAKWVPLLGESYAAAGSFDAATWISSILYGGIIEEVMLRLFMMSLLAFIGWKLVFRKEPAAPQKVLIGADIIAALLFAAGHLPATAMTFGSLTPLLVLRCFLLNGAAGLVFGRLYRRYGIQYAMLSHALFHIISKSIWLVFIP